MTAEPHLDSNRRQRLLTMATLLLLGVFNASLSFGQHQEHHHHLPAAGTDEPFVLASLLTILSFSFFSSIHCAGMCAPLTCSVLSRGADIRWRDSIVYNLARGTAYVGVGALLGLLSSRIADFMPAVGQLLSIAIGFIILGYLVIIITKSSRFIPQPLFLTKVIAFGLQRIPQNRRLTSAAALGAATVLLPCMTLTPMLTAVGASGSPSIGAAQMGAFFLGTLPVMLIAPIVPTKLRGLVPPRLSRALTLVFLGFVGLLTIVRASPSLMHWLH